MWRVPSTILGTKAWWIPIASVQLCVLEARLLLRTWALVHSLPPPQSGQGPETQAHYDIRESWLWRCLGVTGDRVPGQDTKQSLSK